MTSSVLYLYFSETPLDTPLRAVPSIKTFKGSGFEIPSSNEQVQRESTQLRQLEKDGESKHISIVSDNELDQDDDDSAAHVQANSIDNKPRVSQVGENQLDIGNENRAIPKNTSKQQKNAHATEVAEDKLDRDEEELAKTPPMIQNDPRSKRTSRNI
jgi:hypothetical protein